MRSYYIYFTFQVVIMRYFADKVIDLKNWQKVKYEESQRSRQITKITAVN